MNLSLPIIDLVTIGNNETIVTVIIGNNGTVIIGNHHVMTKVIIFNDRSLGEIKGNNKAIITVIYVIMTL